ncbi:MAG: NINE protein [Winogradskyella sp.]|uniref:NINE protein n=1 Tax=Winogradskyella sp. TaxID=1883156 RepID=UPI00178EDC88|nr:NINE protein [Winogradskyella sp.]MBT8246085.1 NINE protein [Winogradskyella sp.]NNK23011.1 NINE protein [Winogradskyella sp.]
MSDDNKNLGDDLNDMIGDAKDSAKKTGDKISQKASELADDAKKLGQEAKEKASEFAKDAKESAGSFASGAQEVMNNKKVLAGIMAILFGALGVHKFILGYNTEGGILLGLFIVGLILSCVGIGVLLAWLLGIVGLIEGIIYLTKSDEEFYNTYQVGKKPWF